MSEELIQKNLVEAPEKMGDWNFYENCKCKLDTCTVEIS